MKKFLEKLDKAEEIILIVLLLIQVFLVFFYSFGRYTQLYWIPWGEEFSRYCMVWMAMIGMIVGAKSGAHFAVTAFDKIMPKWLYRAFVILRIILVDAACLFASYWGVKVVQNQMEIAQVSPALQMPIWIMYAAIPFGLFFTAVRYTQHNINNIKGQSSDEEVQL